MATIGARRGLLARRLRGSTTLACDLTLGQIPAWLQPANVATSANGTYTDSYGYVRPVARITHGAITPFASLGLLYEPAATNLALQSSNVAASPWTVFTNFSGSITRTAASGVSPDGTNDAVLVTINRSAVADNAEVYQQFTGTANPYSTAFWLKAYSAADVGKQIYIGLYNGSSIAGSQTVVLTAGWVRYSLANITLAASTGCQINLGYFGGIGSGTGVVNALVWNNDTEQAASNGTDILTAASAVTRPADAATITIPGGTTSLTFTFSDGTTQVVTGLSSGAYVISTTLAKSTIATIVGVGVYYSFLAGVPAGVLYAAPPNGTITNGNGLIGYPGAPRFDYRAVTNAVLQSNTFGTTPWITNKIAFAQNAVFYDGTTTGWTFTGTSAGTSTNGTQLYQPLVIPAGATFSLYAKAGTASWAYIQINDASGVPKASFFNLATGVLGTSSVNISGSSPGNALTSSITAVGGGWYRISVLNMGTASSYFAFGYSDADASEVSTSGNTMLFADAQGVLGSDPGTYVSTTTAAVTTYQPQGVLIEELRTNSILQSSALGTAPWSVQAANVVQSAVLAPDGTTLFTTVTATTTNAGSGVRQAVTVVANTTYSLSCYVRAGTAAYLQMGFSDYTVNAAQIVVNLSTLAVTFSVGGTGSIVGTPIVQSVGGGTYRVIMQATFSSNPNQQYVNGCPASAASGTGANGQTVLLWGYQFGPYASESSYVSTGATAVTRAADVVQFTGQGLAMLQAPNWSLVVEGKEQSLVPGAVLVGGGNSTTLAGVNTGGTANIYSPTLATSNASTWLGINRVGSSYSSLGRSIVLNAGAVATDTSRYPNIATATASLGSFNNGVSGFFYGYIRNLELYNYTVPNPTLQAYTLPQLPNSPALWTPLLLGSILVAWWDPTVGIVLAGSSVTSWTDRVGGIVASQGVTASQPTFSANQLNFGSAGPKSLNVTGMPANYDAVVVGTPAYSSGVILHAGGNQESLRLNSGSLGYYSYSGGGGATSPGGYGWANGASGIGYLSFPSSRIPSISFNGAGLIAGSTLSNPATNAISVLGGDGGAQSFGILNEILVTTPILLPGLFNKLNGYLAWKYGLQSFLPAGHPYKFRAPYASDP